MAKGRAEERALLSRIVLSWGRTPTDIDLHITAYALPFKSKEMRAKVLYLFRRRSAEQAGGIANGTVGGTTGSAGSSTTSDSPIAPSAQLRSAWHCWKASPEAELRGWGVKLEAESMDSFGPETVLLRRDPRLMYFVHARVGGSDANLDGSDAVVQICNEENIQDVIECPNKSTTAQGAANSRAADMTLRRRSADNSTKGNVRKGGGGAGNTCWNIAIIYGSKSQVSSAKVVVCYLFVLCSELCACLLPSGTCYQYVVGRTNGSHCRSP